MNQRVVISSELYTWDQKQAPGRYPALEEALWREHRELLIALAKGISEANMEEYDKFLRENPGLVRNVEGIARDLLEKQSARTQG